MSQPSDSGRRRVRVITDKPRYRRHQRKKMLRKLVKVAVCALILIAAAALIWFMLDLLFRPRAQD